MLTKMQKMWVKREKLYIKTGQVLHILETGGYTICSAKLSEMLLEHYILWYNPKKQVWSAIRLK